MQSSPLPFALEWLDYFGIAVFAVSGALDMSVQGQIVDLLRRLQAEHDLGYLFISHDLKVVRAMAHRVVVLRHGLVVEEGTAEQIFARPREDYTRALMAAAFSLEADESGVVAT